MKKVSVIIPVYNGMEFIKETLLSCDKQKYDRYEVIIVDDCSTDDSYAYIESLLPQYSNKDKFTLLKNNINKGVLETCNYGATVAKGDCLLFLGQDDILPDNYLYSMMREYKEEYAFMFCNPIIIDSEGNSKNHCVEDDSIYRDKESMHFGLTKECIIRSTGLIINTDKFLKVGMFDTKYRNYGEWNLWIRLSELGEMYYCNKVSAYYRHHNTNMTNDFKKNSKRKELVKYWNECRKLAIKTYKLPFKYKFLSMIYYMNKKVKEILLFMIKRY